MSPHYLDPPGDWSARPFWFTSLVLRRMLPVPPKDTKVIILICTFFLLGCFSWGVLKTPRIFSFLAFWEVIMDSSQEDILNNARVQNPPLWIFLFSITLSSSALVFDADGLPLLLLFVS